MDVVPVEYRIFSQKFHLTMWFFQFITGITSKWYYFIWCIIALLMCIGVREVLVSMEYLQTQSNGLVEALDIYSERL